MSWYQVIFLRAVFWCSVVFAVLFPFIWIIHRSRSVSSLITRVPHDWLPSWKDLVSISRSFRSIRKYQELRVVKLWNPPSTTASESRGFSELCRVHIRKQHSSRVNHVNRERWQLMLKLQLEPHSHKTTFVGDGCRTIDQTINLRHSM